MQSGNFCLIRKNSKSVVDHLQKHYKEDLTVVQGAKLLAKSLNEIVDNLKQNLEFCVITTQGVKFLSSEEIEKLIISIEQEAGQK